MVEFFGGLPPQLWASLSRTSGKGKRWTEISGVWWTLSRSGERSRGFRRNFQDSCHRATESATVFRHELRECSRIQKGNSRILAKFAETNLRRLILHAFDKHGDGAVFVALDDCGLAELDDDGGLQTDTHLRVAGRVARSAAVAAGDVWHSAAQEQLEPALFLAEGGDRAAELECDGHVVVVDFYGIFLEAVEFEIAFGGQH